MALPDYRVLDDKPGPWLYRAIATCIWAAAPKFRAEGTEHLPEEPCVLAGNHAQIYGPIVAKFYIPKRHYIWCAGEIMHRKEAADYAFQDFWSAKPKWNRWLFWLISRGLGPLAELLLSHGNTIAAYHDARLISTYRESITRLQEGNNIVIFPEGREPGNGIIWSFQDKFVDLARFYYKKTGKALAFVPFYVAPALKSLHFGAPVRFDPRAPIAEERERICRVLTEKITALAAALPEHRVVPYPNLPKSQYPNNIPPRSAEKNNQ